MVVIIVFGNVVGIVVGIVEGIVVNTVDINVDEILLQFPFSKKYPSLHPVHFWFNISLENSEHNVQVS